MAILDTLKAKTLLNEYMIYLQPQHPRQALALLMNAGRRDESYIFEPCKQGKGKRVVRYLIENKYAYAFIVNQKDILFYYRLLSDRTGNEVLAELQNAGLDAERNNRGEITIRLQTIDDARGVLLHCFGEPIAP